MIKYEEAIIADNCEYVSEKINKINKRALKIGTNPLKVSFSEPYIHQYGEGQQKELMVDVTIEGEIPKYSDWELVSLFSFESGIIMTRTVPGKEIPNHLLPEKIKCDHCGTNHFRVRSYLLENTETNEYIEVGSSCLKDFFGHDPRGFLLYAGIDFSDMIRNINENHPPNTNSFVDHLKDFLGITVVMINEHGWLSKSKAYNNYELTPTIDHVFNFYSEILHGSDTRRKAAYELYNRVIPKVKHQINETIDYFKALKDDSEYILNCKKIIELNYVPRKFCGMAASMVGTYLNHLRYKENNKEKTPSEWVGEIKERITFDAEFLYENTFEGDFGLTHILTFKDNNDNIFTWFTGKDLGLEKNENVEITGTVKKHDTYKETKKTIITRCKIKEKNND